MNNRGAKGGCGLLAVAAIVGVTAGLTSHNGPLRATHGFALDGDTFISAGVHYRLAEIDAPELPGHCKGYRARFGLCVAGDPWAAQRALQAELDRGLSCQPAGLDYYKRTLVHCRTRDGADLGELLVSHGYAIEYRRD